MKKSWFLKELLVLTFLLLALVTHGQNRKDLEMERKKTQDEIEFTNNLLKTTQEKRQKSVEEYIITNKKIELRQRNIGQISNEITQIEKNINYEINVIGSLRKDLEKLRAEYSKLIYQSYKTKQTNDKLMYVLSSTDFNQAYRRVKYLHQYSRYRKTQIQSIEATRTVLEKRVSNYEELKNDKQRLLSEVSQENRRLTSERSQQEVLLRELTKTEKQLKAEIEKKQKLAEELKRRIEKLIAEEIEKSKKGAKFYQLTPEERLLDDQFASNVKRIPWPLERGIITEKFGEHNHPVLSGIKVRNDGIDISTAKNSPVRAVFNGTVRNVFVIPGMNKVVIIRHGSYLTVYSNLIDVYVKAGENVTTKQAIGVLAAEAKSDVSILKFQIWKENEKLDPERWLAGAK
jgi:septal ring factor EnvC (AmiA/AmiB activator)